MAWKYTFPVPRPSYVNIPELEVFGMKINHLATLL
jgi:hypothetical protein